MCINLLDILPYKCLKNVITCVNVFMYLVLSLIFAYLQCSTTLPPLGCDSKFINSPFALFNGTEEV